MTNIAPSQCPQNQMILTYYENFRIFPMRLLNPKFDFVLTQFCFNCSLIPRIYVADQFLTCWEHFHAALYTLRTGEKCECSS